MHNQMTVELMMTPEEGRRVSVYEFSARMLLEFLKPGPHCYMVIEHGIPEDAVVVGAKYDAIRDVWEFAVMSQTFSPIPDAMCFPHLPVIFARILDHADQG